MEDSGKQNMITIIIIIIITVNLSTFQSITLELDYISLIKFVEEDIEKHDTPLNFHIVHNCIYSFYIRISYVNYVCICTYINHFDSSSAR